MTLYVTEVSDDPGNDMQWNVWLVFQTEVPKAVLETALAGIIVGIDESDPPAKIATVVQRELARRGVTGVQVEPAQYVFINN